VYSALGEPLGVTHYLVGSHYHCWSSKEAKEKSMPAIFNKMLFYRLGPSKYYEIHQERDVLGVKKLIDAAVCFIGCMY
jgi:hypothetical protein